LSARSIQHLDTLNQRIGRDVVWINEMEGLGIILSFLGELVLAVGEPPDFLFP